MRVADHEIRIRPGSKRLCMRDRGPTLKVHSGRFRIGGRGSIRFGVPLWPRRPDSRKASAPLGARTRLFAWRREVQASRPCPSRGLDNIRLIPGGPASAAPGCQARGLGLPARRSQAPTA